MNTIDFLAKLSKQLEVEVNANLRKGSFFSLILGYLSAIIILALEISDVSHDSLIPSIWAFICGTYSFVIYLLARNKKVRGYNQYVLTLFFVSLPTVIYLISYFTLPSGTATYITGPPSYLYFFLIIMTGFLFNANLSIFAGVITGLEYMLAYMLAMPYLDQIYTDDPLMLQDLTHYWIYLFKSLLMVFAGVVVGALSSNTKKLIAKILQEENEKQAIDRLFGQYVSTEIKNKLISEKWDVTGEKKQVAILFSDIRSFSTISEQVPPEVIVTQLNQYLDKMVGCIVGEGGVIDKFVGDGIMATFGGVIDLINPCEAAVKASIRMHQALEELHVKWESEGYTPFRIGIGIHYGEVIQGSIGSQNRKEFTVIGDPVNTASRIMTLTKSYQHEILISEKVYLALPEGYEARIEEVGEVQIRGKVQTVRIFALRG